MRTLRRVLIASMLLTAYMAVVAVIVLPWLGLPLAVCLVALVARKGHSYSAFGTARWATKEDIPHMLQGNGLIVGHIEGKPSKIGGIKALFDQRLSHPEAVRRYLESCQRKKPKHLVRLTDAIHVAAFSPPGGGKTTGLGIPYLLTCTDSMVVVDFKGSWPGSPPMPAAGWVRRSCYLTPIKS